MNNLEDSVVLITSADPHKKDVIGTGFLIHYEAKVSYIVTCAHVVKDIGGEENVQIYRQPVKVIASSDVDDFDLAVLAVESKRLLERSVLRLEDLGHVGCEVKTAGYYLYSSEKKRSLASIQGILGQQKFREDPDTGDRAKVWEIHINQGQLQKGYSGSPVVNRSSGKVVGIVTNMESVKGGEVGEIISIEALDIVCPDLLEKIPSPSFVEDLGDGIKLEMVFIPRGVFLMGSTDEEVAQLIEESSWSQYKYNYEKPQHRVEITEAFYLGKYPITQSQWQVVMGNKPSYFKKGDDYPVENVSWNKCHEFLEKLNRNSGKQYRLPSEAEWEYACRAGTKTPYYFGEAVEQLKNYAWFHENSNQSTRSVGQRKPNQFGLFDIHGNVQEWCKDDFKENYNVPRTQKPFVNSGYQKVIRGGSWVNFSWHCRSTDRDYSSCGGSSNSCGLRVAYPFPGIP